MTEEKKKKYTPAASIYFPQNNKKELMGLWDELLEALGTNGKPMKRSALVRYMISNAEIADPGKLNELSAKFSRQPERTAVVFWVPKQ